MKNSITLAQVLIIIARLARANNFLRIGGGIDVKWCIGYVWVSGTSTRKIAYRGSCWEVNMGVEEEYALKSFNVKQSLVADKQLTKPKRITNLSFGLFGGPEIVRAGEIQVCSQRLYELDHNRTPVRNGT